METVRGRQDRLSLQRSRVKNGEPAETMTDKEEILAAIGALGTRLGDDIAALGTRLETRIDVIANGVGRVEAELATVKHDVLQLRIDLAAHSMQANARLPALEARP